jgi:hypothetical protein
MAGKFKSIWNERKAVRAAARPIARPAVAGAAVDAECGTEGGDTTRSALRALKIMLDRGLIDPREYDERRRALSNDGGGGETL